MTQPRKRRRKPVWKWVALVVVLFAASYFLRGFFFGLQKTYPRNAFYEVKRADMLISITEEGALRALNETVVRSGLEGLNRIIYLVPEGSYVQKGDLLVELDSSGLKDRLNEQELSYQERLFQMLQATGNLNIQKSLVESQIKEAELKVENAQVDLEKYRDADAPLLIKTIESRSAVLAEQVRIAGERYARTEVLFKAGNASKSELEADALSLKREQLALGQYQEDLRLVKKYDQPNQVRLLTSNLEQAKAELDRLRQRTSNEIAQAEADLKTSQSALDFLDQGLKMQRRRLENSKIIAPQNGLVVYASVSPFQFAGGNEDRRREEGRFRMGRGPGGRGGDDGTSGEFRGGGRRGGNRSSMEGSSGESSRSSATSSGGTTAASASANQRIASAISGSSITEPNAAGSGSGSGSANTGSGGGSGSFGGGRSGGGSTGSGGGQNATSAAGAFASYTSMRPSSAFGASSASTNSGAGTANSGASGSSASTTGNARAEAPFSIANNNQFGSRSSSMNSRDFGGFEFYGTPGILEEGTMVRMRQELIRLPDVSKMLAEIKIEEARVAQVRPGMTAYVQVQNIPHRRFKGTVRRIAPLPDSQSAWMNPNVKVYPADILVDDEELPILKPGVSANAEIIITNLPKVLSVPIQTVARFQGENVCFIRKGSRVTPVPVTTGWFNDSFVEITSGLKEGDFVLLAPASDEEVEEEAAPDTNVVDNAPPQGLQVDGPPPAEERRFPRRNNGDPSETGMPTERRFQRGGDAPDTGAPGERRFQRPGETPPDGAPSGGRRFQRRGDDSSESGPPSGERQRTRPPGSDRRPADSQGVSP
jgi:multidrug efflux pump subunit AcrA (membrane-fusion protein)